MMGVIERLSTNKKKAAKGAGDTHKALSELRALGARLRDQRAEIESRPVPLEEAQDGAAAAVLREAETILHDLGLASLMKPSNRRAPSLRFTPDQRSALAFAANAEAVAKVLNARLADHYAEQGLAGLADDDRAAEIAKIDADALAAELAEESVIRSLEADGAAPLRRADADPRATLTDDQELK